MRGKRRLNAVTYAVMIQELQAGPSSAKEVAAVMGSEIPTVRGFLQALHERGCLHIVGYECDSMGRQRTPVYALGEGKDVPRRKPIPTTVSNARWRGKQKLRLVERMAA